MTQPLSFAALVLTASLTALPMAHAALPTADGQGHALPSLAPMLEKAVPGVVNIATFGKV